MIGIYGANGFLGRHLLGRFVARGLRPKAISRRFDTEFTAAYRNRIDFVIADLNDPLAMAASLQDIDTVIQLISTSSPGLQNFHNVSDIHENVIPHVTFLQSCVAAGIRKYIFLSSGGTVYGPSATLPIPETAPTNPISSHGLTKLTIEKYIQMHGHVDGLNYVILRLSNPFGPGQVFRKGQGLIPAILDRHAQGLPVRIVGDGQGKRDYIYLDDVMDAIEASISEQDCHQSILNIGSGVARSVIEVIETMERVGGLKFHRDYVKSRKTDVDINVLDISRARSALGWEPRTSFEDGLERTLRLWRQDRDLR